MRRDSASPDIVARFPAYLSIQDFAVRRNCYHIPRDELSALLQGTLNRILDPTAAGNFHAHHRHAFNVVPSDDLR